jgi:Uma2 family endonuclease
MMLEEVVELAVESTEKTGLSFNCSYICWQAVLQLSQNPAIAALPNLTLDVDEGLTPDICVYPKEKVTPDFFRDIAKYPEMPIIAIEIVSASQNIEDLIVKAQTLVDNGIKAVWTVEPFTNTVFVTDKSGEKRFHNEAVESEGLRVDFRQIFGAG